MSPEAQQIAIAKACGKLDDVNVSGMADWEFEELLNKLPNYTKDLNAAHAAENTLGAEARERFRDHPIKLTGADGAIHATAADRAQAFLRALHLWTE